MKAQLVGHGGLVGRGEAGGTIEDDYCADRAHRLWSRFGKERE